MQIYCSSDHVYVLQWSLVYVIYTYSGQFQLEFYVRKSFVPWSKVAILGMVIPPLIGILISWLYKPLRNWVEFPIRYYREIMGVDRPDPHIYLLTIFQANHPSYVCKYIKKNKHLTIAGDSMVGHQDLSSYFMSFCDDHQDVLAPRYIAHIHLSEWTMLVQNTSLSQDTTQWI